MEGDNKINLTGRRSSAFKAISRKSVTGGAETRPVEPATPPKEGNTATKTTLSQCLQSVVFIGTGVAIGGVVGSGLWVLMGGGKLLFVASAGTGGVIGSCIEPDGQNQSTAIIKKQKIIKRDSLRRKSSTRSPSVDSNCSTQELSSLHSQNSTPSPALPVSALKRCDSSRSDKSVSFRTTTGIVK
eukprot:TRINITY_DN16825_c0_g2_i1.p1 TRINITY_DN16825_c0_g2~~TRINITY_DN16825_c0_g2_i1.p1  ORF type:complete len:185 (+),score=28.15 TRINITY_DN16825_c0_g2_i1:573-1127(+)